MAEQVVADLIVSLTPSIAKNWSAIVSKIHERRFRINESDVSIYCTLFNRFKKNYTSEFINDLILKAVEPHRYERKDCSYKIQNTSFTLIPYFTYIQPDFVDFGLDGSDYQFYPDEHEKITFVPGIIGVTIYVFFQQNTKKSIINCQRLLEKIQNMLLKEANVKQQGKFLYLDVEDENIRNNILQKITEKYNTDEYVLKNQSSVNNEIKIRYSDFLFRILDELLRT